MNRETRGLIVECPEKLLEAIERVYSTPGHDGAESLLNCLHSVLKWADDESRRVIIWDDGTKESFCWSAQRYDAIEDEWNQSIFGGINWSEVTEIYTVNT